MLRTVAIALVAALVVGLVFSVVDAVDDYAGPAALVTFLLVLLGGFLGVGGRGRGDLV